MKTALLEETRNILVADILKTAYLANGNSEMAFSINYEGNFDSLRVRITKSKKLYNDVAYQLGIFPDLTTPLELLKFREVLEDIIAGGELDLESLETGGVWGLRIADRRNEPPYIYPEEREDDASN